MLFIKNYVTNIIKIHEEVLLYIYRNMNKTNRSYSYRLSIVKKLSIINGAILMSNDYLSSHWNREQQNLETRKLENLHQRMIYINIVIFMLKCFK